MLSRYKNDIVSPYYSLFDYDLFGLYPADILPTAYRAKKVDRGLEISLDVPGVKPEDLNVTLEGRTLKVKGQSRGRQLSYSYIIPRDYDASAVDAQLENGVLTLVFDRAAELEPKKVEVRTVS